MAIRSATERTRRLAAGAAFVVLTVLVLSGFASAAAPPPGVAPAGPSAGAPTHPAPSARSTSPGEAPATAHPLTGNGTNVTVGTVYNSTHLGAGLHPDCFTENYTYELDNYCLRETQDPTLLTLGNGELGVGYSIYTTTGPACNYSVNATYPTWTTSNIAWAHSTTNGTTWSPGTLIGTGTCRWPSASEPTFAAGPGHSVDAAFVLSNASVNGTNITPYYSVLQPELPPDWGNTTGDALGFVSSANYGKNWTNVTIVPGITSASRPQIAVTGSTIYVAYIFFPTSNVTYSVGNFQPNSTAPGIQVISSTNGGSTWSAPTTLPGENASMGNWSTNPSIAVGPTGVVSVAYATNRQCVDECYYYIFGSPSQYADDIVYSSSTTNGTSWTAPTTVAHTVGETPYAQDYYDDYDYANEYAGQTGPGTAIALGANDSIYVAYSGGYELGPASYENYEDTAVFASLSTNGGANWTNSTVNAVGSDDNYDDLYSPSITVSGGTAYIAYVWQNETDCFGSNAGCNELDGGYSSWIATSTNGLNWTNSFDGGISAMPYPGDAEMGWQGQLSSVTIGPAGTPVTATTLPGMEEFRYGGYNGYADVYDYTDYANVTIGYAFTGPTTYALVYENNLPPGTAWGVSLDGYVGSTTGTFLNFTNVPTGVGIPISPLPPPQYGYRTIEVVTLSLPGFYEFPGPTVGYANFTKEFGIWFNLEPTLVPYEDLDACGPSMCFDINVNNGYEYTYPALPWYVENGTPLRITTYGSLPTSYWNGTGPGSVTGASMDINVTVVAPFNETGWAGSFGVYNQSFHATGLPSTSVYTFTFDGVTHSSPATSWTNVSGVDTGGYSVTDISANSSTAGWEYIGWVAGGSDLVVVPDTPDVEFEFADVDVAAPTGTVTFHAAGVGNGTVWSVEFNGTDYSSSTPWLNVTTHPGTYPWAVGSAVAANGSVGYAPQAVGPTVSVTTGSTVSVAYTPAYRVTVIAGIGGTVSGAGSHWLAVGANATYTAVPANGYEFAGWTGTGYGSYTGANTGASLTAGGAIVETASFYPLPNARFNVTFQQTNVPTGTWWSVYLDGVGYSSNTTSLVVPNLLSCAAGASGQYTLSVPDAYNGTSGSTRYYDLAAPPHFCTNGGTVVSLTFLPQYQVSVAGTPGGTDYIADGADVSSQSLWANSTDSITLSGTPNSGYRFGGWNGTGPGSYNGSSEATVIVVDGPVTEFATFVPLPIVVVPRFTDTFVSTVPFPSGTSWSVTLTANGVSTRYAGVGPSFVVTGLLPATYSVAVSVATASDGLTRWAPAAPVPPDPVTRNGTTDVTFERASYWVTIAGSTGGTVGPASGWQPSGATLTLNASPNLGESFLGWQGLGATNYTGNDSSGSFPVGGPVTEFATFAPVAKAATVITSVWSGTTTWALLAVVGLVVGLVVGVVVSRFRGRSSTASSGPVEPWSSGASAPPEESSGPGGST